MADGNYRHRNFSCCFRDSIPRNRDGTTMGSRGAEDLKRIDVRIAKAANILAKLLKCPVDELTHLPVDLVASISAELSSIPNGAVDYSQGEVNGIHPSHEVLIRQMLQHINTANYGTRRCFYNWASDSPSMPACKVKPNRPDIYCGVSDNPIDIDFILEIKPRDDIYKGILQAATYAAESTHSSIELCRTLADPYTLYMFASNGVQLAAGKVVIHPGIHCCASVLPDRCLPLTAVDEAGNPIADANGKFPLDLTSTGVRALYAVLQLSQEQMGFVGRQSRGTVRGAGDNTFQIVDMLGKGSYATVYHCLDTSQSPPVPVAVKTGRYLVSYLDFDEMIMDDEHAILVKIQTLSHKSLPVLYGLQGSVQDQQRYSIVFAGIETPLAKYLAAIPNKEDRDAFALAMKPQLESAVEAVYGLPERYCHTDVRPANITVRGDVPILIDWGLACAEGTVLPLSDRGDKNYMSEEMLRKKSIAVDVNHDYYAICCVVMACMHFFTPKLVFSKVGWEWKF